MNNRTEAFTIYETLVILVLNSLLFLFAYQAIKNLSNAFTKVQVSKNEELEISIFLNQFITDIKRNTYLTLDNEVIFIYNKNQDTLKYHRNEDHIIRVAVNACDTFKLNKPIFQATTRRKGKMKLVTGLKLQFDMDDKPVSYSINKAYSSKDLMSLE